MAHDGTRPGGSATGSGGIGESLSLVERWEEDEGTRVGPGTVLKRHKALTALARRLGARSLAEATLGDVEGWLATVAPRTKETYASRDLRMTQELMGHSSPNTTTIYAAWSPGAALPIVQGLSPEVAR